MKNGSGANILVVSGPSGCGKTTLIRRLLMEMPDLEFSVSHTTRTRRPGETQDESYHFVTFEEFERMIASGELVEWADVHEHRYGTSWEEINRRAKKNKILVLDLDVQGGDSIRRCFTESSSVFILPPSMKELRNRLIQRETRMTSALEKRLDTARREMCRCHEYDFVVVNDALDRALEALIHIVHALQKQPALQEERIRLITGENQ